MFPVICHKLFALLYQQYRILFYYYLISCGKHEVHFYFSLSNYDEVWKKIINIFFSGTIAIIQMKCTAGFKVLSGRIRKIALIIKF